MTISIRRLRWILLGASILFLGIVEWVRYLFLPHLGDWQGRLLMEAALLVAILFFIGGVFELVAHLQSGLERQNRELLALHDAGLAVLGELRLENVLQKVVDQACQLLGARYGALSVVDEQGGIRQFVTSGVSAEESRRIGSPPEGKGLLGVVLHRGERLRLEDLSRDPRSAGFPQHHPPMHSLLAVPIPSQSPFRGNLYVAESRQGKFSAEDEETLCRFATTAAFAIDNAHLHQQLKGLAVAEERVRIAREMHDGMAQVLAYVNTKAQAVQALLKKERTGEALEQLDQLAAAAREVYTDVREGIVALRTQVDGERSLRQAVEEFVTSWRRQSGIACDLQFSGDPRLPATVELQLLRIVQEGLSNVRKHALADRVEVSLLADNGHLSLEICDNGRGFDASHRHRSDLPRFGLAIMRERAESVGATFELETAPGAGTRLRVDLTHP